jgi:hypothetical protein
MAGKPRNLTDDDKEFLAEVPHLLRVCYPGRKPTEEIARDFGVSVHTAHGWLYRDAFPIERKREFIKIGNQRIDYLDARSKEAQAWIIENWLDGIDPRKSNI